MLKTSITRLLDSLDGNSGEIPKIIHELCGKTFIFRFKLSEQNLAQGKEYYLVKRTFDIDEKLELKRRDDKVQEHQIKDKTNKKEAIALAPSFDELEDIEKINRHGIGQEIKNTYDEQGHVDQLELNEEIHNDKSGCEGKNSSTRKLNVTTKKKRRSMIVIDDSDEESKESYKKKVKVSDRKTKKKGRRPVDADVDNAFAKKKKALDKAFKTAARLEKRFYGKKTIGDVAENSESISTMKDSKKASRRLKQKKTIQKRRKERKNMMHTEIPNNKEDEQRNSHLNDTDMDNTIPIDINGIGKDNNNNSEDVGELSNSDKNTMHEKSNEDTNNVDINITREGITDPTKGKQAPTLYRSRRNRMLPVRYRD
ncbi:unnamed protein product [Urochloa humidicola]